MLDIFEDILEGHEGSANVTEWRPRIEHAQIMQLSDIERAGKLGGLSPRYFLAEVFC